MTEISFAGRVAIVTGAGGGIGRTHALEIARRGGSVLVNDIGGDTAGLNPSPDMADAVVAEIRQAGGIAFANYDSVADTDGASRIVAQAIEQFGRVDILINNAGNWRAAFLEELTDEDWDAVLATHLTGAFKTTRAVWPYMKSQGYGRLVYTASSAGLFGMPMVGAYGAAKAGVAGLMHTAALEGAEHGILSNAIMPNGLSRMAAKAGQDWIDRMGSQDMTEAPEYGNSFNVEFNMPIAVFLASEACKSTHGLYSQCLGRIANVFLGVPPGWQSHRQAPMSVEDVADHWEEICDRSRGFKTPETATEELGIVLAQDGKIG